MLGQELHNVISYFSEGYLMLWHWIHSDDCHVIVVLQVPLSKSSHHEHPSLNFLPGVTIRDERRWVGNLESYCNPLRFCWRDGSIAKSYGGIVGFADFDPLREMRGCAP
jgi:hypothetical protein